MGLLTNNNGVFYSGWQINKTGFVSGINHEISPDVSSWADVKCLEVLLNERCSILMGNNQSCLPLIETCMRLGNLQLSFRAAAALHHCGRSPRLSSSLWHGPSVIQSFFLFASFRMRPPPKIAGRSHYLDETIWLVNWRSRGNIKVSYQLVSAIRKTEIVNQGCNGWFWDVLRLPCFFFSQTIRGWLGRSGTEANNNVYRETRAPRYSR